MNVTIATAAVTTLLFVGLSLWVVDGRRRGAVSIGDGGDPVLLARMRAQANLAEYAPLMLILLLLAEQAGGGGLFLGSMAVLFVLARIAHPAGMVRPAPNALRAFGMLGTWIPLIALALALLVGLFTR